MAYKRQFWKGLLGAICGFIYISYVHSIKWTYWNYILKKDISIASKSGGSPPFLLPPIETLWVPIMSIIIFAMSSYIVHKYLEIWLKSVYLLWLTIMLVAVAAINIMHLVVVWVDVKKTGNTAIYQDVFSPMYPATGLLSFGIAIIVSLIFSSIVQVGLNCYQHSALLHE